MKDKIEEKKKEIKRLEEESNSAEWGKLPFGLLVLFSLVVFALSIMASSALAIVLGSILMILSTYLYHDIASEVKRIDRKIEEAEKELFFLENEDSLNYMLEKKLSNENKLDLNESAIEAIKEAKEKDTIYVNPDNLNNFSIYDLEEILDGPEPSKEELANYRKKVYEKERKSKN